MNKNKSNPLYDQSARYAICIRGQIDAKWATWFGGLQSEMTLNGNTTFVVNAADQSELYGLLRKIRDSGLEFISINRFDSET